MQSGWMRRSGWERDAERCPAAGRQGPVGAREGLETARALRSERTAGGCISAAPTSHSPPPG